MSKDKTNHSVTFTVDVETKEKLQQLADQEERTLSAQLSYLFKKKISPDLDRMLAGSTPSSPQA